MIRTFLSFLAAVASGIQVWLIITKGEGFCLNDGCDVVERLTTIPSLYFYGLGAFFFALICLCSAVARFAESEIADKCVGYMLTAGMAAEGVLIFFQYSVAHAFCGSCLMVFAFIVLLTLFSGMDQIMRGLIAFCAVLIAAFALQFDAGGTGKSFTFGTMATYTEEGNEKTITLLFSETCPHCEKVLDYLQEESSCNVRFNPIEKRTKPFIFAGALKKSSYDPTANIGFMRSIGVGSIPLLIAPGGREMKYEILNGTNQILPWLERNCRFSAEKKRTTVSAEEIPVVDEEESGMSTVPDNSSIRLPVVVPQSDDDKCGTGVPGC
ncbi:hypothetical protein JWG39_06455 [Desulforhopalus vacuolatus]|uniref:hypothetical protein n=1 Tax=Desulforhopalus vacuolatus TaxID=40414 RepID=UPI001965000F|nr:hypothetical protein [Desulforhopalus vacuolatus]MBM9519460.1 hypothetical protein [Desulforhopalus vacuolatus]